MAALTAEMMVYSTAVMKAALRVYS